MNYIIIQDVIFVLLLVGLSFPLGNYIYNVMTGQKVFLSYILSPVERIIYKTMGIQSDEEMSPKKYTLSVLLFSGIGLIFVFLLLMLQNLLPLNPEKMGHTSWHLALNTAVSFITNTNWQAYAGESTLSYFTQVVGLTVQNFVSAATGIAVVFTLIRCFIVKERNTIGNFWRDLTRTVIYILIPLSIILGILLVSQGVVQTLSPYKQITALEMGVTQTIPLGPAASQIAIKQIGTNGGGFFGANSAFPLENPTAFSNLLELLSILLIPASLCITFGKAVKDNKQGRTIYAAMLILFVVSVAAVTLSEHYTSPNFTGVTSIGNMEGKEVINGVGTSALWGTAATAASSGSVNSMHDSFTPLGGMVLTFLMQLGEIVFGGVGSGLYGMLAFVILTVFIAGLMVGRTPEYLGKKIEPYDMKMVCIVVLAPSILTLLGATIGVLIPNVSSLLKNSGPHGFSEVLYAFTSLANNNGSSFAGFMVDTPFINVLGGIIMLAGRFIPMTAVIFLSGNLSKKKTVAVSEGTLSTSNGFFVGLLIAIIVLISALGCLPALALGPLADYFSAIM